MSNLVRYGAYSDEAAEADAALASSLSGSELMDIEIGDNFVRFLPPKIGVRSPHRVTATHYVDAVPGLDKTLIFACPRVELKQPCLACIEAERLSRNANKIDRERAFRISGRLTVYSAVSNRTISDFESSLRVLKHGKTINNQLKGIRRNKRTGGDYTDPTGSGFDICINREGTGLKTEYDVSACRDNSPLAPSDELINWAIANAPDLERYVKPIIPEELIDAWESTTGRRVSVQVPRNAPTQRQAPQRTAADDARQAPVYDEDFNLVDPPQ